MRRLTKAEIKAGLEAMPMETILLGVATSKQKRLTHKQTEFARQIALGESKASAYRKSHKSKGKPRTQSREGQKLAQNPTIATQIEAFKVALEAQKYQTPAHLRALTIHKLTEKALSDDVPPAQQIKALELLGKITEVALFTERREVIQTTNSAEMRDKLMASIKQAIENSKAIDVEARSADELLTELVGHDDDLNDDDEDDAPESSHLPSESGGEASLNPIDQTPPTPDPQISATAESPALHSIPHIESPPQTENLG